RMVLDVGAWDASRAANAPGQSGDPSSPHYADLLPLWRRGDYFPLLYTRAAAVEHTERTIRHLPAPRRAPTPAARPRLRGPGREPRRAAPGRARSPSPRRGARGRSGRAGPGAAGLRGTRPVVFPERPRPGVR